MNLNNFITKRDTLTHADERSEKPVQITADRRSGKGPGPRLFCTCFYLFLKYQYHYLNQPLHTLQSMLLRNWESVFPIQRNGF